MGLFDAIAGVINTGVNAAQNAQTRGDQLSQNAWQNNFAREQFDYQKQQNETTLQREDTAMQRRVFDLQSAGLNPIMAAGGGVGPAAASQAHGTSQSGGQAPSHRPPVNFEIMQNALMGAQIKQQQAQAALTSAEAKRVTQQTDLDLKDYDLRAADQGLRSNADARSQQLHPYSVQIQHNEALASQWRDAAARLGVSHQRLTNTLQQIEAEHYRKHGTRIPSEFILDGLARFLENGNITKMINSGIEDVIDSASAMAKNAWHKTLGSEGLQMEKRYNYKNIQKQTEKLGKPKAIWEEHLQNARERKKRRRRP